MKQKPPSKPVAKFEPSLKAFSKAELATNTLEVSSGPAVSPAFSKQVIEFNNLKPLTRVGPSPEPATASEGSSASVFSTSPQKRAIKINFIKPVAKSDSLLGSVDKAGLSSEPAPIKRPSPDPAIKAEQVDEANLVCTRDSMIISRDGWPWRSLFVVMLAVLGGWAMVFRAPLNGETGGVDLNNQESRVARHEKGKRRMRLKFWK